MGKGKEVTFTSPGSAWSLEERLGWRNALGDLQMEEISSAMTAVRNATCEKQILNRVARLGH